MDLDVYIGSIELFPYTFAPRGWAFCNGQILNIYQNQVLYSLIGNLYGGNTSQGTFALPNMQGMEPIPGLHYCIALEGLYPPRN